MLVVKKLCLTSGANYLGDHQTVLFEEIMAAHGYPIKFAKQHGGFSINLGVDAITIHQDSFDDYSPYQPDSEAVKSSLKTHWLVPGKIVIFVAPELLSPSPVCGVPGCTQEHYLGDSYAASASQQPWQPKGNLISDPYYPAAAQSDPMQMNGGRVKTTLHDLVPDFDRNVKFPCDCICSRFNGDTASGCGFCGEQRRMNYPRTVPLSEAIVTLNDHCRWPRERIADWLDTLDLDLRFRKPDPSSPRRLRGTVVSSGGALGTTGTQTLTNKTLTAKSGEITFQISPEQYEIMINGVKEAVAPVVKAFSDITVAVQNAMTANNSLFSKALLAKDHTLVPKNYKLPDPYCHLFPLLDDPKPVIENPILQFIEEKKKASATHAEALKTLDKSKKKK